MSKHVTPSTRETAFSCPHCGALTTQYWYRGCASASNKNELPFIASPVALARIIESDDLDADAKHSMTQWYKKALTGRPFVEPGDKWGNEVTNLNLSKCYNCDEFTIWVGSTMVWPEKREYPVVHDDLPDELKRDYDEAGAILQISPRGAAALLRLTLQKLMPIVGGNGKNINDDIAELVRNGLHPRIQMMLDTLRVIGNEAVHPGTMDIKDDIQTAEALFRVINTIVDNLISQPKHIEELYGTLPESKRAEIERRDAPKV